MKRLVSLFMVLALLLAFSGCSFFDGEELTAEEYLERAEELVEEGKLRRAESLLKRGIRKTDDNEELQAYLEIVQAMLEGDDPSNGESVEGTRAPVDETDASQAPTQATQQTESPTGINMLDSFNAEEMYKINVFLSNFSEQGFQAYPCDDYDLINFGYIYAKINNREVLGIEGYEYYVHKADMDSILNRFFGATAQVSEGTATQWMRYSNGTYYFPAADGASYSYCTVATSMVDNGNGTYTVDFAIYEGMEPHMSMSPFYSMTHAEAAVRTDISFKQYGTAVVRDYTRSSGAESYQLISYELY